MVIKKGTAVSIEKQGVTMRIYNNKNQFAAASVVYQETQVGHMEEFYHSTSNFIFYIIEGSGTWFIKGEAYDVSMGDVVIVPVNTRFYYTGQLKQVCITCPAWDEENEHHIRNIES
jgi:mannose-6-phosphate isomerase-like protein (cupin superfamily)